MAQGEIWLERRTVVNNKEREFPTISMGNGANTETDTQQGWTSEKRGAPYSNQSCQLKSGNNQGRNTLSRNI